MGNVRHIQYGKCYTRVYIDIFSMGNVRHIQYRDFFWLRFTGGGDPLLKGAPFAGRPSNFSAISRMVIMRNLKNLERNFKFLSGKA